MGVFRNHTCLLSVTALHLVNSKKIWGSCPRLFFLQKCCLRVNHFAFSGFHCCEISLPMLIMRNVFSVLLFSHLSEWMNCNTLSMRPYQDGHPVTRLALKAPKVKICHFKPDIKTIKKIF